MNTFSSTSSDSDSIFVLPCLPLVDFSSSSFDSADADVSSDSCSSDSSEYSYVEAMD